jgi:heme-degrading monooxygenase HmoA
VRTAGVRAAPVDSIGSLIERRDQVIGVNVTFEYNDDFDRARVIAVAENARSMFEGMPGLRCKFFTLDDEHHRATNFYVWESKDAADGFFSEELRERVTGLYGVSPTIDFVEIVQMVDNSSS